MSEQKTQAPAEGDVVVTWNHDRSQILAVTRQDREGHILKVIAEVPASDVQPKGKPAAWLKYFPRADKPSVVPGDTFLVEDALAAGWIPLFDHPAPKATQAPAPAHRTDAQIVEQTEALAKLLMSEFHQREPLEGKTFRGAIDPRAQHCWLTACKVQELLTDTDPENAVAELEDAADMTPKDAGNAPTPAEHLPTKEHIRELAQDALDQIMEQAQVFASAWSLVGGKFDTGNGLDDANDAKAELRTMVRALADLAAETVRPAPAAQDGAEAALAHIAAIAHEGGLAALNEGGALSHIRSLCLPHWDDTGGHAQQRKRVQAAIAPHEGRTAALSPGVPLDAVVGRQNVTTE